MSQVQKAEEGIKDLLGLARKLLRKWFGAQRCEPLRVRWALHAAPLGEHLDDAC